jgi:hypothetical protein
VPLIAAGTRLESCDRHPLIKLQHRRANRHAEKIKHAIGQTGFCRRWLLILRW